MSKFRKKPIDIAEEIVRKHVPHELLISRVNMNWLCDISDAITAALDAKTVKVTDEEIEKYCKSTPINEYDEEIIFGIEFGAKWIREKYEGK